MGKEPRASPQGRKTHTQPWAHLIPNFSLSLLPGLGLEVGCSTPSGSRYLPGAVQTKSEACMAETTDVLSPAPGGDKRKIKVWAGCSYEPAWASAASDSLLSWLLPPALSTGLFSLCTNLCSEFLLFIRTQPYWLRSQPTPPSPHLN